MYVIQFYLVSGKKRKMIDLKRLIASTTVKKQKLDEVNKVKSEQESEKEETEKDIEDINNEFVCEDISYFKMDLDVCKVPMQHVRVDKRTVLVRHSYKVIANKLLGIIQEDFQQNSKKRSFTQVSGNPGTGKSRFLIYFLRWITLSIIKGTFKSDQKFILVYNCSNDYYQFIEDSNSLRRISVEDLEDVKEDSAVLRLVEGSSNDIDGLHYSIPYILMNFN